MAVATPTGGGVVAQLDFAVLEELHDYVATKSFLHTLEETRASRAGAESDVPHPHPLHTQDNMPSVLPLLCHNHFAEPSAELASPPEDDFVVVDSEEAVQAMAYYIAMYLSRMPEAQAMPPAQLQAALKDAFKVLRKSRYRQVWDWGRFLYRWSAIGYSATKLYENPWLVRVIAAAIWASARMACGFII